MTDAKRITSLSAAILLAAQLFTPFIPAAYADDKKGQNTTSIATSETAMQSSLEEDKEADIKLESEDGSAADFFACINGDLAKVSSTTDLQGPEHLAGRERYYLTAEQLESVYAPFGFAAETCRRKCRERKSGCTRSLQKDAGAYKVLALTTCASDYSNARTVIITLLQE